MIIKKEFALSNRSTCRSCCKSIPVNAPRAKISYGANHRTGREQYGTYCKPCALQTIQAEINNLNRELAQMEAYK